MPPTENSAALFGWHSQDSRATGPLDTADTVTAHYGTGGRYPRFVIWENVYGALSSNGGDDFEIVLNELLHLTGSNEFIRQHGIWGGFAGYGEVAYRVVDAKYWGVPQRRKRVYAVADTGGKSANEILFDRKGDEWNFRPRLPAGKAVAGLADDCYCWHERMVQAKSSGGGISPTR